MHWWSLFELQGASTPWTPQDGASSWRDSAPRRALRGARSWARLLLLLLLGLLLVPGAWSFLSEEQEELLVELHNYYRGQVSPSASAMLPLKWDPNLKLIAEGYAAKCIWNHNPDLEETGENLFAGTGPPDLREAVEKWFMENLDYDFQNNTCDDDKMCGHYTQMVWADTHRVGCALHICNSMEGLDWKRASFLVCNYFPAGNYEGVRPYVEGDWCSGCPENFQKCENNLCVPDLVDDGFEEVDSENTTAVFDSGPTERISAQTNKPLVHSTISPSTTHSLQTESPEEEETLAPETTTEILHHYKVTLSTPGGLQKEVDKKEEEVQKEVDKKKGEVEKEVDKKKGEVQKEEVIIRKEETRKNKTSAASASAPSVLFILLTGMLTLRL